MSKRMFLPASALVILLFFGLLLWTFTAGMSIGERDRNLKPFARHVALKIAGAADETVAIHGVRNSSLIFYLDRKTPVRTLNDVREVCSFAGGAAGGYLLTGEAFVPVIEKECGPGISDRVLSESRKDGKRKRNDLVLLLVAKGP